MVLLFLRTNQLILQTFIFFVVIIYWPNFWTSLVSSSNIQKLKYFTSTGCTDSSTLPHLISLLSKVPLFTPKTHRSTWDLSLTGSSLFINTSTIIRTKLFQQSNIWSFLGTHCEELTQFRNTYCINAVYSPSLYMVINYGSTTMLPFYTLWKSWGKCKEELLFGYWELSKHCLQKILKLLQDSFLLNSIFRNSQADLNYILLYYLLATL